MAAFGVFLSRNHLRKIPTSKKSGKIRGTFVMSVLKVDATIVLFSDFLLICT